MLSVAGLCEPTSGEIMRESVYGAEKEGEGQWWSCWAGHVDRMAGVRYTGTSTPMQRSTIKPLGITQPRAKSSTRHQVTMPAEIRKRLPRCGSGMKG
jgi:hypothetical protein